MLSEANKFLCMHELLSLKNACIAALLDKDTTSQSFKHFQALADPATILTLIERLENATKNMSDMPITHGAKANENLLPMLCDGPTPLSNLTTYFEALGRWHWPEITEEAQRVLETLLGRPIEESSTLDNILSGVASQSGKGAYASTAAMLGIDGKALQAVASDWEESQDNPPRAITFDELRTKILLYKSIATSRDTE